jgi:hypothetical protein
VRAGVLAILVGCSAASPAGDGCCRSEHVSRSSAKPIDRPWTAAPEQVQAIEAVAGTRRVTVTRDPADAALAWCRVVTQIPNAASRVLEFPVEGRTARELFRSTAALETHESLGALAEAEVAAHGLDGEDTVTVTIDGEAHRLRVGRAGEGEGVRAVLDVDTGRAWIVADDWWRSLAAAERLLPLRKLVERRGLEAVTIAAPGRRSSLVLRGDAWVSDDPTVGQLLAEIVPAALRLRPGPFDRELDASTLEEIVRFEFTGGERPQTLVLFTDGAESYYVRSTRAAGLAKVHHLDAIALAAKVAEIPRD